MPQVENAAELGQQSPVSEDGRFYRPHQKRPWWIRLLDTTGLMPLRHRHFHTYEPSRPDSPGMADEPKEQFPFPSSAFPPVPRRKAVIGMLKGACIIMPIVILVLFGILHILQVVIGRVSLLWDIDHDHFLPNWGKTGHYGEGLADYPTDATRDVLPVPIHSHNDYWRRIPLWDALHYGCTGVEADVWLFDDDLFVGHNTASLSRNRTFQSLYVDPLIQLLDKQNPHTEFANTSHHGVFDEVSDQTLVLLVDLKTDGPTTLPVVEQQLEGLRSKGYLTYFNGTHTIPGAITVVGTGNTPFDQLIANTTYRDIFFDAPLERLWAPPRNSASPKAHSHTKVDVESDKATVITHDDGDAVSDHVRRNGGQGNTGISADTTASAFNSSTSYYASISFTQAVGRVWRGHLSQRQMDIIRGQIRGAKQRGLKARYWDTPAWPISLRNHIWHVLVKEGADMLNADDLRAAARQDWRRWRHEWW
ncbi:hypothetical protein MBLNU459_g3217t1 [Dothideomycetes sp. NU459]